MATFTPLEEATAAMVMDLLIRVRVEMAEAAGAQVYTEEPTSSQARRVRLDKGTTEESTARLPHTLAAVVVVLPQLAPRQTAEMG